MYPDPCIGIGLLTTCLCSGLVTVEGQALPCGQYMPAV